MKKMMVMMALALMGAMSMSAQGQQQVMRPGMRPMPQKAPERVVMRSPHFDQQPMRRDMHRGHQAPQPCCRPGGPQAPQACCRPGEPCHKGPGAPQGPHGPHQR